MKIKLFAYASRFTPFSPINLSVQEYENVTTGPLHMMPVGEFEIDLPITVPTDTEFNTFCRDAKQRARLERMETLQRQLAALEALPTDAYNQITQADESGPLL
jgi:hypothetical protein